MGGLLAAVIAGFCTVVLLMLLQLRHDSYRQSIVGGDNLLAAVSQDIARNVELFDLSLQAVVSSMKLPGLSSLTPELRQAVLFDRAATAEYLNGILILDAAGNVTDDVSSVPPRQANFSDRNYFRYHQTHLNENLRISRPFIRRLDPDKEFVIAFSRRLNHADGSFAGVVVGLMRIGYFRDLFSRFALGPHGSISLSNDDGILLMRTPYDPANIGLDLSSSPNAIRFKNARAGRFEGTSRLDGISRIYTFKHVGTLPLTLSVALSETDIYETWRTRAVSIGGVLLLLCLATVGVGALFRGEHRERSKAEARTRLSEAHYRLLADHATDVIFRLSPNLVRTYVSPASRSVLGYLPDELLGSHPVDTVHPDDWAVSGPRIEQARRTGRHCQQIYRMRHKAGHYVWAEAHYSVLPDDGGFIVVLRDISKRKKAELQLAAAHAQLLHLATTDGLTHLANRRRFDEAIDQEWHRSARQSAPLSLLLLDVDRFKAFNDQYGHPAGDDCLRRVATAVAGEVHRPGDLVARYGGEELVILLPDTDEAGAAVVAAAARAAVEALGLHHEGNAEHGSVVTVSIGLATIFPAAKRGDDADEALTPSTLIDAADRGLYRAKHSGRNCIEIGSIRPDSPGNGPHCFPESDACLVDPTRERRLSPSPEFAGSTMGGGK